MVGNVAGPMAVMLAATTLVACRDGHLVVALGEPVAATVAASTGLDSDPDEPGWRPGLPYGVAFQDFESVNVRLGGAVVVETGPAEASFSGDPSGVIHEAIINVKATVLAAQREALVADIYRGLLSRGWRYRSGSPPDVVGKIAETRWQRCLDGYDDGLVPAEDAVPGSANLRGATFERTAGRWRAEVGTLFGCRLDSDGKNPFIDYQYTVNLRPR